MDVECSIKGAIECPYQEYKPNTKNNGGERGKKPEGRSEKNHSDQDPHPTLDKCREGHPDETIICDGGQHYQTYTKNKTESNRIRKGEQGDAYHHAGKGDNYQKNRTGKGEQGRAVQCDLS